jgi:hypothetical protein
MCLLALVQAFLFQIRFANPCTLLVKPKLLFCYIMRYIEAGYYLPKMRGKKRKKGRKRGVLGFKFFGLATLLSMLLHMCLIFWCLCTMI